MIYDTEDRTSLVTSLKNYYLSEQKMDIFQ